jgi:uncharacterized protein YabN with tetrapyrrole methylase and pyrophosphatase domain
MSTSSGLTADSASQPAQKRPVPVVAAPHDFMEQFRTFVETVRILRTDCPWDRKQTHETLMPLLIEETYEAAEAAQNHDATELSKELGDILLHVVMNAVIAEEHGSFTLQEVIARVFDKLISRHPHVFLSANLGTAVNANLSAAATNSDASIGAVENADDVQTNWEKLKMKEGRTSALEGVPKHLPALLRAQRTQEKASRVGFDWHNARDAWKKVLEEVAELEQELESELAHEPDQERIEEEFGDVLFSLVNAARLMKFDAEQTLQNATNKFTRRFQGIEALARQQGRTLDSMTLAEMDALWEEVKHAQGQPEKA